MTTYTPDLWAGIEPTPADTARCVREGLHLRTQRHSPGACPMGHVLPRDINSA